MVSIRSTLSAGVAAVLVVSATGAAVVSAPVAAPALRSVASPAIQLSAVMAALPQPAAALPTLPDPFVIPAASSAGDWIINGYNAIQPWVQYGVELGAWAFSWLPWPIGLIGPQADILYSGWQPIGQSLAYSAAYLLDRQFELIVPTLVDGLRTGVSNLVQGEIQWVLSFFPPLPPINFPVLPGAATLARSAALPRGTATIATSAAVEAPTAEPAPGVDPSPAADPDAAADPAAAADPDAAADPAAAAETAPAAEAAPTPRMLRPGARSMARAQRSTPAASAVSASAAAASASEAPATKETKETKVSQTAMRAGKTKAGAASSTRKVRAAR